MTQSQLPVFDYRNGGLPQYTIDHCASALALRREAFRSRGAAGGILAAGLAPVADRAARFWLQKQQVPYLDDITTMTHTIPLAGVWALNFAVEWCCTSGVYTVEGRPVLVRVLDFVFDGLGRHCHAVQVSGTAGAYYALTWPGFAGVIQGVAPRRFAAAINMAPMRQYGMGIAADWLRNKWQVFRNPAGIPPALALRQAFEQCQNYQEAVAFLQQVPLATPIIFTLSGLEAGQGCVIERLEQQAVVRHLADAPCVSVANDFVDAALRATHPRWLPRPPDCAGRYAASCALTVSSAATIIRDLQPPVINSYTRLVLVADIGAGQMWAQGWEANGAVTAVTHIAQL